MPRNELLRDLAVAIGWAVFVGVGLALGLALGSLGADVPADGGMLSFTALITGVGTLIVRLVMVGWKHRGAFAAGRVPDRVRAPTAPSRPTHRKATPARKPASAKRPGPGRRPPPGGSRGGARSG